MADTPLSSLPASGAVADTHLFYADTGAADVKVTGLQLKTYAGGGGGGTPGGSDKQVQFNDGGAFGGSSVLTFDKTAKTLTLDGGAGSNVFVFSGAGYVSKIDTIANALAFHAGGSIGLMYLNFDANNGLQLKSDMPLAWSSGSITGTSDVLLKRDAGGVLSQRNGVNAQTQYVYNTYTDAANYERGVFDWKTTANTLIIGQQYAGSGQARSVILQAGGGAGSVGAVTINSPGGNTYINNNGSICTIHNAGINGSTNGGMSLGAASVDWGTIYMSAANKLQWSSVAGSGVFDTAIGRSAAGVIQITGSTANIGIAARTKAGAFAAADVPAGSFIVGRDTSGSTTKLYYNNGGTLMSVGLT
jgi:hypothetical protein